MDVRIVTGKEYLFNGVPHKDVTLTFNLASESFVMRDGRCVVRDEAEQEIASLLVSLKPAHGWFTCSTHTDLSKGKLTITHKRTMRRANVFGGTGVK